MSTLEELKQKWGDHEAHQPYQEIYSQTSMKNIIRKRIKIHTRESFKYFWSSLILQIIVYSLLSHSIIKEMNNPSILYPGIAGILLYIPFTVLLLKKFKQLAISRPKDHINPSASIRDYLMMQLDLLNGFYSFKKRYELLLIPISCGIGVFVFFEMFLPGGVREYSEGAVITYFLTLTSCAAAIFAENKKSFAKPITQIRNTLMEFDNTDH